MQKANSIFKDRYFCENIAAEESHKTNIPCAVLLNFSSPLKLSFLCYYIAHYILGNGLTKYAPYSRVLKCGNFAIICDKLFNTAITNKIPTYNDISFNKQ